MFWNPGWAVGSYSGDNQLPELSELIQQEVVTEQMCHPVQQASTTKANLMLQEHSRRHQGLFLLPLRLPILPKEEPGKAPCQRPRDEMLMNDDNRL